MNQNQKKKLLSALTIIIFAVIISFIADYTGFSSIFERKTIDTRTKLCRKSIPLTDDIVIILIDESSLQAMNDIAGRWPWPRYIHAELIDYLALCGAESVVMDILFTENQLQHTNAITNLNQNDLKLALSTENAGNVYHAAEIIIDREDEVNTGLLNLSLPDGFAEKFSIKTRADFKVPSHNSYILPFKELSDTSYGIGIVTFYSDYDTVNRSEKLLFNYHDNYFPSHGLAPALKRLSCKEIFLDKNALTIKTDQNKQVRVPLVEKNEYYINIYGRYNKFSYSGVIESMIKVQNGVTEGLMVSPEEFEGKIVYIGASAAATFDIKNTSIGKGVPGVYLHASICGNILTGDFLKFYGFFTNFIPFIMILSLTVFSILYMKKAIMQIYFPIILFTLYLAISVVLFRENIVISVATPSFAVILSYFASFTYISFTEGKEKRKVKNILGQYVSPAMLSEVLENSSEEYLKAEVGTKENLTVFFSDIRGFTTISERFPVEKVVETLNSYLSRMVDIIFEHSGTLDKFIGDAVVAFWGAPVKFDDHHYKAVISAVRMIEALKNLNAENKAKDLPELKIGIGIHTDDVILGNIGSKKKLDYTVIGDGVNLTSRLEGLTKAYYSTILISQTTYEKVSDKICCRIADYVKVKGKDEPIIIYDVLGETAKVSTDTLSIAKKTDVGFEQYKNKEFHKAICIYEEILNLNPDDNLIKMFMERCNAYIKISPPENWDGCYTHTSK